MTNYCAITTTGGAVGSRATNGHWGVDLNRNNTVGSLFDGYDGASTSCTSEVFTGPAEASEAEIKNEHWIGDTFTGIKFANNIHTHGGYFMWAPGAYIAQGRVTLPAPNIGIEKYFFEVADTILSHIRSSRNTAILPQRVGPIADVLYSAAGNSADENYYKRGIIAYSFEAGAQRLTVNPTTGAITRTAVGFQPCFAGPGTSGGQGSGCGTVAAPNLLLVNEGHDSAMEFSEGNFGMIQGALDYSKDVTAPDTAIEYSAAQTGSEPINSGSTGSASLGHLLHDRRFDAEKVPTASRGRYNNQGPRRPGEVLTLGPRRPRREVDGGGHQGQPGGQVAAVPHRRGPGERNARRHGAGDPVAEPRDAGDVRRVHPGHDKDYTASTTANVISTAGDATLSVSDPSPTNTGKLVHSVFDTFTLAQPINASASSMGGTGAAFASVGGSASPTSLLNYSGPKSNDSVTLNFRQTIGRTEALRTGAYGKTLTFTLSTTTP